MLKHSKEVLSLNMSNKRVVDQVPLSEFFFRISNLKTFARCIFSKDECFIAIPALSIPFLNGRSYLRVEVTPKAAGEKIGQGRSCLQLCVAMKSK